MSIANRPPSDDDGGESFGPAQNRAASSNVAIAKGAIVYEIIESTPCTVVQVTEAYCIYRVDGTTEVSVSPWSELAISGIAPDPSLLPPSLQEVDLANARAALLREFLEMKQWGLSPAQSAALEELKGLLSIK